MRNFASEERRVNALISYYNNPNTCMHCGKIIEVKSNEKPSETRRRKFCANSCAAKYNNKKRIFEPKNDVRIKTVRCFSCDNLVDVNIRASNKTVKCDTCKQRKKLTCKYCGQFPCISPLICKKFQVFPSLNKYFGMNISVVGTKELSQEFERIKSIVKNDFNEEGNNIFYLMNKYGHTNVGNFYKILCSLGVIDNSISKLNKSLVHNKNGKSSLCRYHTG